MNEKGRHYTILEPSSGYSIFSVDDLWFTPILSLKNSVNQTLKWAFDNKVPAQSISRRIRDLESALSFPEELDPHQELSLLRDLIILCKQRKLGLVVSDFVFYEANFETVINLPSNGLLLDVHNAHAKQNTASKYGVISLKALLRGHAPKAKVCFITRAPPETGKVIHAICKEEGEFDWSTLGIIPKGAPITELEEFLAALLRPIPHGLSATPSLNDSSARRNPSIGF